MTVDELVVEARRLGLDISATQSKLNQLAGERRSIVSDLLAQGCSLGFVAGQLGVTRALIQQWRDHDKRREPPTTAAEGL